MASSHGVVRVVSRRLVHASDASMEPHVVAVSNLDLLPQTIQVSMVCVYPRPSAGAGGFDDAVAAFASGLPTLLNHFFPLAGRVATNPASGLPELHCGNQGAELVVGEASVALAGLDWSTAGECTAKANLPYGDGVALSVQVVSFACGGFTVAWATNHVVVDGSAVSSLVSAWSELARTGGAAFAQAARPSHDRSVFRPRAAPSYDAAALDEAFAPVRRDRQVSALTRDHCLVQRMYYVEAADVARLRETASPPGSRARATRVQALSAYLWKALAAAVGAHGDDRCRMGWWVDARRRVASPVLRAAMRNYAGNATTYAIREAGAEEIRQKTIGEVAAMVREAVAAPAAYDEHLQDIVDWVEEHKGERYVDAATVGLGSPTLSVTAFASFPLDTDFGFGHAALAMPTSSPSSGAKLCSGFVRIGARPGGDGSWIVSVFAWPALVAALESDEPRVFKTLTAELLGLGAGNATELNQHHQSRL